MTCPAGLTPCSEYFFFKGPFQISCISVKCRVLGSLLPLTADVTLEETDNVSIEETAG